MSGLDTELDRLANAAVDIAMIPKPELRHKGGFWLHGELEGCWEKHVFSYDQRVSFMSIVKILLDIIFRDAVEGPEDMKEFGALPSLYTPYVQAAQKGALEL